MQLSGDDIQKGKFIDNADPAGFRPASYDLHVGHIIKAGSVGTGDTTISPQQMFILISKERVKVPSGHVAYAMPKTSLCNKGILVLNTGIIDPGWEGKISTTAINFDKDSIEIRPGDAFLRVVFHQLGPVAAAISTSGMVDKEYIEDRRKASEDYPKTFLDIERNVGELQERVATKVLGQQNNLILLVLSVLSILFFLWNLMAAGVLTRQTNAKEIADRDAGRIQAAVAGAVQRADSQYAARIRQLEARIQMLESPKPVPTQPSTPTSDTSSGAEGSP
jgi:dUTPase